MSAANQQISSQQADSLATPISHEDSPAGGSTPLDLDDFVEPTDEGLSLNELSQAYAALLAKGNDPYPDAAAEPGEKNSAEEKSAEPLLPPLEELTFTADRADADAAFAVTPRGILEAILFVGHPTGEPLTSERIAALMRGVQPREIDDLVRDLNDEYAALGAPYSIVSVGPGYQMTLRPEFASLSEAFLGRVREARLSQAAIDCLAIVAYNQPIAADQIDRIRGKPSGAILSQLVRRDLLVIQREAGNRKVQYHTTDRFLALFGLQGLDELPRSHENDAGL
jgi:segregation and condensation protein B